nr:cIIp protein 2 [Flammulina filiformis]
MQSYCGILIVALCIFLQFSSATRVRRDDDDGIPRVEDADNQACVPWYGIRDAIMGDIFHGKAFRRCNDLSRAAIRLAFHDAAPFSLALKASGAINGAADGSIIADPAEVERRDNNGLQTIAAILRPLPAQFNVSEGDIVAVAGALAVLACPGGPVIKTYVGRPKFTTINPDGLLPDTNAPVDVLLARFRDMGFDTRELMALIGAHSASKQRFVDVSRAGQALDSTVDLWDVRFYSETQRNETSEADTFILPSDRAFAHNSKTKDDYNRFVGFSRQSNWGNEYAKAHEKMSLLGYDKNSLTECTEILPEEIDLEKLVDDDDGDPIINPAILEAAIQRTRSIWLV